MSDEEEKRHKHEIIRNERGYFAPGHSGNPGGKVRLPSAEIQRLFAERSTEAVQKLWSILCTTNNERLKVDILKFWVERAGGKMPQMIAGPDGDGLPEGSRIVVMLPPIENGEDK